MIGHWSTIAKEFSFEAAHRLPRVAPEHKCSRMHGHSYRVEIALSGTVNQETGMLVDFAQISAAWRPLHDALDHHTLNDIEGLENPTSEILARWIWRRLESTFSQFRVSVTVRETATSRATYASP